MSTRATYRFIPCDDWVPDTTIYIHYDGYPEGAAHFIASMLAQENLRGGWPCMFIRANELAELTKSHESHGDTEYRYDLDEKAQTVTVYRIRGARTPDVGETKDVLSFITQYAEEESTPRDFALFDGRYVLRERAVRQAKEKLDYALRAFVQGWTGNASGALADVLRNESVLDLLDRNTANALKARLGQNEGTGA